MESNSLGKKKNHPNQQNKTKWKKKERKKKNKPHHANQNKNTEKERNPKDLFLTV